MNNNFFTLNGKKYVILFGNLRITILRKENDKLVLLNEEEKKEIISILNNKSGYRYDSEKIMQIINSNNTLDNKGYLSNFLQWLENIIPLECRENFYNNIKTLKTDLNLDINFSESISETKNDYQENCEYNGKENTIIMTKNFMLQTGKIAQSIKKPADLFWKSYSKTLLHELAHMSSSHYDVKTGILLCGFDKFPSEKEIDKNRGLTEGFTEIISMAGVPGTIEIASSYYIEASLINQLIQIIGVDVFIKSYFSNLGTKFLESELCNIIADPKLAFQLFRNIEINFQIRNLKGKQSLLGNIQLLLLDYLEKRCEKLIENNKLREVNEILKIYEQMLITPEKLKIMDKNPDDYEGLVESITKFKNLQEKLSPKLVNIEAQDSVRK